MEQKLIVDYEAGGEKLRKAIADLSSDDLRWTPEPDAGLGNWSIQQIIVHMMDSDVIWTSRMKSIIAEEHPTLLGYDENRFANSLHYNEQDPQQALRIFDLNRKQFCRVLRKLPESAFSRTGQHSERGSITLGQSLKFMVEHVDHHLNFILKKRRALGKDSRGKD
jgi:uncharacterized damage-inducible protein DinB